MNHTNHKPSAPRNLHRLALLGLVAGSLTLVACNRQEDERTVGQEIDSTISQTERKAEETGASMQAGAKEAQADMAAATSSMADSVKDAAITTAIKAELARDSTLSAMDINVDTEAGRVLLRGSAPDAVARDRAYSLATGVDGVLAVNNELVIKPN